MDQHELSVQQFGRSAANYLTSPVHATGEDLERLASIAGQLQPARVLDLGCGAGHASFALARGGAGRVTAYDPSSYMLDVVAQEAAARGHRTIETLLGSAEVLPFAGGTFDLIVTRYSAHHWRNVPRALEECARVAVPGARLIVIDSIAPETPLLDTALQVIEFLRDASHVRDYRISEWRAMQGAAGFAAATVVGWRVAIEFNSWIARIGTKPGRVAALQAVFADLPTEVLDHFKIDAARGFELQMAWLDASKAA